MRTLKLRAMRNPDHHRMHFMSDQTVTPPANAQAANKNQADADKELKRLKRRAFLKNAFYIASTAASGAAVAYALKACTVAALCTAGAPLTVATTAAIASTGFLMGTYRAYRAYKQDLESDASARFFSRKTLKTVAFGTGLSVLGGTVAIYYGDVIMEAAGKLYEGALETLGLITYEPPQPMMTEMAAMPEAPVADQAPAATVPVMNEAPVFIASMTVAPTVPEFNAAFDTAAPVLDTEPPAPPAPVMMAEAPATFTAPTLLALDDTLDAFVAPELLQTAAVEIPTAPAPLEAPEAAPAAPALETTNLALSVEADDVAVDIPEEISSEPLPETAIDTVPEAISEPDQNIVAEAIPDDTAPEAETVVEEAVAEEVTADAELESSSAVLRAHELLVESGTLEAITPTVEPVIDTGADETAATDNDALSFSIDPEATFDPMAAGSVLPFEVVETHTVSRGDNLWNIVKDHYGLTSNADIRQYVDDVAQANGMSGTEANNIDIGDDIMLPAASTLGINTELAMDWRGMDAETAARMQDSFRLSASYTPQGTVDCQPQLSDSALTFQCQASGNAARFSIGDTVVINHMLPKV